MDLGLKDKNVVITGSTGGIGSALIKGFLREGARVAASFRKNPEILSEISQWCLHEGIPESRFHRFELDLKDPESFQSRVTQLEGSWGLADVLVNNAGYAYEFPFVESSVNEIHKVIEINFTGTILLSQIFLKQMLRKRSGNIVTISSAVSEVAGRGVSVYASLKAVLNRWTEIVSTEYARKGLRANAVAPAVIETRMTKSLMAMAGEHVLNRTPMQRIGQPEEVVSAVLFLASDKQAAYITGQTLFVDGGMRGA
jgi:NAD(P)-dependent dehydrogenase (short-subunit alcohol dehydrogenase family)